MSWEVLGYLKHIFKKQEFQETQKQVKKLILTSDHFHAFHCLPSQYSTIAYDPVLEDNPLSEIVNLQVLKSAITHKAKDDILKGVEDLDLDDGRGGFFVGRE